MRIERRITPPSVIATASVLLVGVIVFAYVEWPIHGVGRLGDVSAIGAVNPVVEREVEIANAQFAKGCLSEAEARRLRFASEATRLSLRPSTYVDRVWDGAGQTVFGNFVADLFAGLFWVFTDISIRPTCAELARDRAALQ